MMSPATPGPVAVRHRVPFGRCDGRAAKGKRADTGGCSLTAILLGIDLTSKGNGSGKLPLSVVCLTPQHDLVQ